MSMDRIRVGVIGAGANTRSKHIPGLRKQNNVEIVGVANRSEDSSRKAASELDAAQALVGRQVLAREGEDEDAFQDNANLWANCSRTRFDPRSVSR